ncbi:N-acetylmuramoyl-L-alanine amidase [Paenibacillus sp. YN15]|uniref:N-acetylmuramoyl-L-alanine amidase n=1 Tax=Paenibacillus sp. YN15 TaxID=1742774 RepID=UPI000DCF56D7|nr:N-acetylmuramoyl-L-alanine amidase [Paenibacillus sp. YN15]RAV00240.1 N-acetylmuramoyl-L-alanine amidase [Paenibacillus sp. YN15]
MTVIGWRAKYVYLILAALLLAALLPGTVGAKPQNQQTVCVDPGHPQYGNNALEPVAPGSKEMKAKVSSGTRGVKTQKPEYVLTLEASLLLKEKLESFGYQVVMTRESHDVDISNVERAQMCNAAEADLAVRIHADGAESSKAQGISLLYPAWTEESGEVFNRSKEAAGFILRQAVDATGAASRGTVPRSDLTGFNWSTVPSVLVEMGFMTNPDEDARLSDPDYLDRLTEGIAVGINLSLASQVDSEEAAGEFALDLTANTQLYIYSDGKMTRTRYALSPQTVYASAKKGSWARVNTWVGQLWVYVE